MRKLQESQYANERLLSPIEIAPNSNLVDLSHPCTPRENDSRVDVNVVSKSSKFKKLSPKIYKVKQSNMLYSVTNPMVFQEEKAPISGIKTSVETRSPKKR